MHSSLLVLLVLLLVVFIVWKNTDRRSAAQKQADFEQLQTRAEAGEEDAQYQLLLLYYTEKDPQFFALAFKWALAVAQKGEDPGVMLQVGEMYENGHGTPKDLHQALVWYERALSADTALEGDSPLSKDGHLYLEQRVMALRQQLQPAQK